MRLVVEKLSKIGLLVVFIPIEPDAIKHISLPEPVVIVSIRESIVSPSYSYSVNKHTSIPSSVVVAGICDLANRLVVILPLPYNSFELGQIKVGALLGDSGDGVLGDSI